MMPVIDGLQYANWSEKIFREMRAGGVDAVHVTRRMTLPLPSKPGVPQSSLARKIRLASKMTSGWWRFCTGLACVLCN